MNRKIPETKKVCNVCRKNAETKNGFHFKAIDFCSLPCFVKYFEERLMIKRQKEASKETKKFFCDFCGNETDSPTQYGTIKKKSNQPATYCERCWKEQSSFQAGEKKNE